MVNILFVERSDNVLTKDRLMRFGVVTDGTSYLCGEQSESHMHWFFDCPFSKAVVLMLQNWLIIKLQGNVEDWIIKWRRKSLLQKKVVMAVIFGLVYGIWDCRNTCRVELFVPQPKRLIEGIHSVLKVRLNRMEFSRGKIKCCRWLQQTGLSE
ncbi:uncharacterized protein LOC141632976 [Silene latifolia]|uniref:uncharacterized protein LOC141632976 n=1 Tax=Silene latifolia TaxID=37657 RepID=UPI003D770F78